MTKLDRGGLDLCKNNSSGLYFMTRDNISRLLEGGDRRSIGLANKVAEMVAKNPKLFPKLVECLWSKDRLVRMRAADAAEKVTREKSGLLTNYKKELLGLLAEAKEPEMRWHLAVMVPRLSLDAKERRMVMSSLREYLLASSSIVKTFALQGMADLARDDAATRNAVMEILREGIRKGTPAMRARSRKLIGQLEILSQ
jgi:hypothetical protein